jgi:ketosteroid isomerase-like protein
MKRRQTRFGVWAGVVIFAAASSARADGAREGIDAGNRAFVTAFLRGDARAISLLYAEDAQVIAPGAPVAKGRAAIAAAWQKTIDSGVRDVKLETEDVASSGDVAGETGRVRIVGKDGSVSQARYVVVWKRVGSEWKLFRDIWNAE